MKCVISHSRRIRARLAYASSVSCKSSTSRFDFHLSRHVRTRDDPVLKCPSTSQRELDLYCEEILRRGKSQLFPLLLSATWSLWTQLYSSSCNFNQKSFDRYLHLSRIGGAHVCCHGVQSPEFGHFWGLGSINVDRA